MRYLLFYNYAVDFAYHFINLYIRIRYKHIMIGRGGKVSFHSVLEGYNRIDRNAHFSGFMGKFSYIGSNSIVVGKIGRFCSIGGNVTFLTQTHPVKDWLSSHPVFYSIKNQVGISFTSKQLFNESPIPKDQQYSIEVGNDVYIGYGATLVGPIKIGNGAVIAAGSVVTKDVPPYCIVAGVPAKIIKNRFSEEQAVFLEEIRWWENSEEWLRSNAMYFDSFEHFKKITTKN